MRIEAGFVGMESARSARSLTITSATTSAVGSVLQGGLNKESMGDFKNYLSEWASGGNSLSNYNEGLRYTNKGTYAIDETSRSEDPSEKLQKLRQQCVMYLLELLFGYKSKNFEDPAQNALENTDSGASSESGTALTQSAGNQSGSFSYFHTESETTMFETTGTVRCSDGREIEFNLSLEMSRSFTEYYEENHSITSGTLCDPLVINLDGAIPELSDQKFFFDIDHDGQMDQISRLGKGSGYLALDINDDGVINDGSELFGTASGDGFRDLAGYDSDRDGWIDEDDDIFDMLKIWVMDEKGGGTLYSLKDAGVGAICLQNVSTQFSLNSLANNTQNGQISRSGVFLFENGNVGTVQHLDLVK